MIQFGFEVLTAVTVKTLAFCSPVETDRRFGNTNSIFKVENEANQPTRSSKCSFETSVNFYRTTRRHITEDVTLCDTFWRVHYSPFAETRQLT
jgi:hypothetical protein